MPADRDRSWRLFIATPVPQASAHRIQQLLGPYVAAFPKARWQPRETYHVTLRFLGATSSDRTADLAAAIRLCASSVGPFPMVTGQGSGVVRGSGGVAWLRFDQGATQATAVARCLFGDDGAGGRPVEPHLTVARRADSALIQALSSAALGDLTTSWVAERIVLYRSHTGTPAGSTYEPLMESTLSGVVP